MDDHIEEENERRGFFDWLRSRFRGKEGSEEAPEVPRYKRKLLDGRIEKYLDKNMDAYIQEYSILTGLDIESIELRYASMTSRISGMKEYMTDADAMISAMEKEISIVQTASKKK